MENTTDSPITDIVENQLASHKNIIMISPVYIFNCIFNETVTNPPITDTVENQFATDNTLFD